MNALHINSEREAMANSRRIVPENQASHVQSTDVPRSQTKLIKHIATERISSISVTRTGLAFYELFTATDIDAFKKNYPAARFVWNETLRSWNLFEAVGDLGSCVIRIRPA